LLSYQVILKYFEPLCPPATETQVAEAEDALDVSLPPTYREFLKHLNGGFQKRYVLFDIPQLEQIPLDLFHGIGTENESNDLVKATLDAWYWNLPNDLVLIGRDPGGNRIVLGVKGPHIGKVFYWDSSYFFESSDETGNIYRVSNDFDSFMESLRPMESRTAST
jgi:cell wall assembly regulator SMI1